MYVHSIADRSYRHWPEPVTITGNIPIQSYGAMPFGSRVG